MKETNVGSFAAAWFPIIPLLQLSEGPQGSLISFTDSSSSYFETTISPTGMMTVSASRTTTALFSYTANAKAEETAAVAGTARWFGRHSSPVSAAFPYLGCENFDCYVQT